MRILVVEDDPLLFEGLTRTLTRAGHSVEHAANGVHADVLLTSVVFDLVVLDVGLPDMDGFEALRRLRSRGSQTSVLILTARDAVEDRVHGLNLGADDYLPKPFSVEEFEARVRSLLRRGIPPSARWAIGSISVDFSARCLRVQGIPIELTRREWSLLELLLMHAGRVLSKDVIADSLFSSDDPLSPNAIEAHVSRLRSKIEPGGVHIRTVRGFGYLLEPNE